MRDYILNTEDIEKIIKTGKFDKEENAEKLICACWTAGDILDNYLDNDNNNIELERIKNLKKLYQDMNDNIEPTEYSTLNVWEDLNKKMDDFIKENRNEYIKK